MPEYICRLANDRGKVLKLVEKADSESELLERYERMPSAASANHPAMAELSRLLGRRR